MSADSPVPETTASAPSGVERERQMLIDAESCGTRKKLKTWLKLSGPGWLQSAITLGGGSLAGSLFLGMIGGYSLLWLQIMAMAFGVVMLGAIGYVTLSTGERPFGLINKHVNPVLGWGWALATLAANIVWCLPQFSLANAAVQQNLAPSLEGQTALICGVLLAVAIFITMIYDRGGSGMKTYENTLRILVGFIVLSFFGVVVKLASTGNLDFGAVFAGLIPDISLLSNPASTFDSALAATGDFRDYWTAQIVGMQRDVMITAAATAVGINMTFLFPYSLLKKDWDRAFRGLSIFDLATGMAIPFVVATGCVVIASANQFHAKPAPGLLGEMVDGKVVKPDPTLKGRYEDGLVARIAAEFPEEFKGLKGDARKEKAKAYFADLPEGDKRIAAMLVKRDAKHLAAALATLIGDKFANYVFGFGVLAMALSTITILMLISGFTFCEVFGFPQGGFYHRVGCLLPAIGVLGPFVWSGKVAFWLAVPTSVFGMVLLPIAYFTFFLLMNNKKVLGDDMPRGQSRVTWNVLMGIACFLATVGAGWAIWDKAKWVGVGAVVAFVGLALFVHIQRLSKLAATAQSESAS
jgi:Mn2+/Fe2+ NRAMP family transporter